MFMVWLLWIFVVAGGLFMGTASVLSLSSRGLDPVVAANALLYLGESSDTEPVIAWLCEVASSGLEENTDRWYRSRLFSGF